MSCRHLDWLSAFFENSGQTMIDVMPDHSLRLHGFRRQVNRELAH